MKCINCKQLMIVLELDQVEVDYCLNCGGTWLDAGELGLLLDKSESVKQVLDEAKTAGRAGQSKRKCPICHKRMDEIEVGSKGGVSIDRCREGHGLWFDRGELKTITTVLGGVADNKVAALLMDIFGEKQKSA